MISICPILSHYPTTIAVNDAVIPLNTDFRLWLSYLKYLQEENTTEVLKILDKMVYYCHPIDENTILKINEFLTLAEHKNNVELTETKKRINQIQTILEDSGTQLFDIFVDMDAVIADFIREYRIDLTDETIQLHWLHFKVLLNNLSQNSSVSKRKEIRQMKTKEVSKENVETLKKIQQIYKITTGRKTITAKRRNELLVELSNLMYESAMEEANLEREEE